MKEATAAFPDLSDFEFFVIILQDSSNKLRLPDKFAKLLDGQEPREVTLREASGGGRVWDVEVVFDGVGHMYLDRGWEQFSRVHGLELGHLLVFCYDGDAVLTVKVFDGSMCRRHYHEDEDTSTTTPVPPLLQPVTIKEEEEEDEEGSGSEENSADDSESSSGKNSAESSSKNSIDSGSNNSIDSGSKSRSSGAMSIDDAPTSQFTVMLRQCHLGVRQKQYLNVPVDFQIAHEYHRRSKVILRMGGKSWPVTVKRTGRPAATGIARAGGNPRTSLRYGWHQFCVDNRLGVGDTCFFRALRGSDGEEHELKVEVRRRDGTFAD